MTEEVKEETQPVTADSEPATEALDTVNPPAPTGDAEPTLGQPVHRRRTSKVDAVLADAKDVALAGLADIAPESAIGPVHHLRGEEERLTTHLFECTLPGYRGWFWFATLSRAPRSKKATVCEVGLIPGDDALLAPAWVPWADRLLPEDRESDAYDTEGLDLGDDDSDYEQDTAAGQSDVDDTGADEADTLGTED